MNTSKKLRVALVGLGFGAEFAPIYLDYPDVVSLAICAHDSAMRGGADVEIPDFGAGA